MAKASTPKGTSSLPPEQLKALNMLRKNTPNFVPELRDVHANVIQSPSPSFNSIFGKAWGIPRGYGAALFGPAKSGKSLIKNMIIGHLHKSDPTAIVIDIDTEGRVAAQLTPKQLEVWGIDRERHILMESNSPDIFDYIAKDVPAAIENGLNVQLICIDSISGIDGILFEDQDKIKKSVKLMADHARTIKAGVNKIRPVLRKHQISYLFTTHVAAIMDEHKKKQAGRDFQMSASNSLQHTADYFICIEPNKTKDGRSDIMGESLVDEGFRANATTAKTAKGDRTGHRIRATMVGSSLSADGRQAEFTLDYTKGLINVHEEVFSLGINREGVIERPNNLVYKFKDKQWNGKPAILKALQDDPELQKEIIREVQKPDVDSI